MIRFFATLMLILIGLKVAGFTTLAWFWVLFPVTVPVTLLLVLLLVGVVYDAWRWLKGHRG